MTPKEFKSWFEGFTEAFSGMPTYAQWVRIKERVAEIDGKETTERVFIDRYWPSYPYPPSWIYTTAPVAPRWVVSKCNTGTTWDQGTQYSNTTAMYALGKAEGAASITG